jgi:hypothetical protein
LILLKQNYFISCGNKIEKIHPHFLCITIKMKYLIRIFADGYETSVKHLKKDEITAISNCLIEYVSQQKYSFTIEMSRYYDPVALNVPSDFKTFTGKRIHLNPFGFHKKLEIQFDIIDSSDRVCYCYDIWCEGNCGTLYCGCMDICRGKCGASINSYFS